MSSSTNSPRWSDDSGLKSIRAQSGIAGGGAGDKLLWPLLSPAPQMPSISLSNHLTHSNMAKDLLLLSLLSQVPSSALFFGHAAEGKCVWTCGEHAGAWIQSTQPRRCLLLVDLNEAPPVHWHHRGCIEMASVMLSKSRSWKEQGLLLLSAQMSSDNASANPKLCLSCLSTWTEKHVTFFFPKHSG